MDGMTGKMMMTSALTLVAMSVNVTLKVRRLGPGFVINATGYLQPQEERYHD
jgi:hypothetical protein